MSSFHLQIVTPDGLFYDGQAESLNLRAAQGGLTILPRHTNFVTTVGMGPAKVVLDGNSRVAACIGGMLSVINGEVRLIATTFEWAEDIDRERAKSALERAEAKLADASLSKEERRLAESAKRRAQVRLSIPQARTCKIPWFRIFRDQGIFVPADGCFSEKTAPRTALSGALAV